jgi:hypothetical protein
LKTSKSLEPIVPPKEPESIRSPEPEVKGLGFSKDLPDIDRIRHNRMPAQLRKYPGRQLCKICLSNAGATVLDLVGKITYQEIAKWLTETDPNGIVYNATNVSNHMRHATHKR